jgi:Mg-chelatase subunit ChlD
VTRHGSWLWGALVLALGGTASGEPFRTLIMIDASSSMRRTDPQKLRKVAAELYVDLAREGDLIAVSQFDAAVKDVSGGFQRVAGPETRERLKAAIRSIGDNGEWTDFGAAFSAAGQSFGPALPMAGYEKRFLVFLTDGRCEPAPGEARYAREGDKRDPAENERRCQEYVLARALPEMKGVEAEVIGLSRGAPREFLKEVARRTGGREVITERAEDLPRLFAQIHAFNSGARAAEPKGSEFAVDKLVSSLDLVIVSSKDGDIALRRPGGEEVRPEEHGVRLVRAERYRLFHVPHPAAGTWSLKSVKRLAPGIATAIQGIDLQLKLEVPETATAGQPFEVRETLAAGEAGGMPEESFLARHRFVVQARADEATREIPMRAAADGARVGEVLVEKPGSVEIWGRVEPGPDGALTRIAPNVTIPVLPPLRIAAASALSLGEVKPGAKIELPLDLSSSQVHGEVGLQVMPEGMRIAVLPKRIVLKPDAKRFDLTFEVPSDAQPGTVSAAVLLTPMTRPYAGRRGTRIPVEAVIVPLSFFQKHGGKVLVAVLLGAAAALAARSKGRS